MDRMLYVAMSGAAETLRAQAASAHNLANVSTTGFRADLAQFRSMPLVGPGLPTRVYALAERPGVDLDAAALRSTGRSLDVAVDGNGLIAVQARDGVEAYTRAGDLRVDANGQLTNGAGFPVLGDGGPIALPPASSISIAPDGTVSVVPPGQSATAMVEVDRIRLVNPPPQSLLKGSDGLLRLADGATAPADATVHLVSGALEDSNANAVEELVRMIDLSRRFELQVRMMKVAEEDDASAAQLMRAA